MIAPFAAARTLVFAASSEDFMLSVLVALGSATA